MPRFWPCLGILLIGCFSPKLDFGEGALTCADGLCPPGYRCAEGTCWRGVGSMADAHPAAPADAALTPPDAEIGSPDAENAPADAALTPPDAEIAPPDAGVAPPDAGVAPPDVAGTAPDAGCAMGMLRCDGDSPQLCTTQGTWQSFASCQYGCADGRCVACVPDDLARCAGKCGEVINNCQEKVDCSVHGGVSCVAPETCGGGTTADVCGCTPETRESLCQGKCGPMIDNCDQMIDCGGCTGAGISCGAAQPNVCGCDPDAAPMCGGLQRLVCVEGAWVPDGAPCDFNCSAGKCVGACSPGDLECNGNVLRKCGTDYAWADSEICPKVCLDDACAGVCVPGEIDCDPATGVPRRCGMDGQWDAQPACTSPQVCVHGGCFDCKPGETGCTLDGIPRSCVDGKWVNGTACSHQVCQNGACQGVCAPPDTTCSGRQGLRCSSAGSWEADPACAGLSCWLNGGGTATCTTCIPNEIDACSRLYNQCNSTGTGWIAKDSCSGAPKKCGSTTWGDPCGNFVDCGGCGSDPHFSCSAGRCVCSGAESPCTGENWGSGTDVCGKSYTCTCAPDQPRQCSGGICVSLGEHCP